MKPKDIKKLLFSEINSVSKKSDDYCISSRNLCTSYNV